MIFSPIFECSHGLFLLYIIITCSVIFTNTLQYLEEFATNGILTTYSTQDRIGSCLTIKPKIK